MFPNMTPDPTDIPEDHESEYPSIPVGGPLPPVIPAVNESMETDRSLDELEAGGTGTVERKKAAPKGGYYTVGKTEYWFDGDFYDQVLKRDDETPMTRKGDKEFAAWLKAFIKDNLDNGVRKIKKPKQGKWGWNSGHGLSDYWAMGYSYGGKNGTDPQTARLATVLRAVKTVLSVVDPAHHLTVQYVEEGTSSWAENSVSVPAKPARELEELEEAINVESGFSIHEAWHSQHSRILFDIEFRKWLMLSQWNQHLWNIAEDVRIEEVGLQDTPGYREYLNYVMEYLWDEKNRVPEVWNTGLDEKAASERAACFFLWAREPERAEELLTDPSFTEPKAWIAEWLGRYVSETNQHKDYEKVITLVQELKDWLRIPVGSGVPQQQMVMTPCGFVHKDDGLSAEGQDQLEQALEAQVHEVTKKDWKDIFGEKVDREHIVTSGATNEMASAIIFKPRVVSPHKYKASQSDLVAKAKAALSLRRANPQADTRLMRSGVLDEDELHRFFSGDYRMFKDATVDTIPDAAVYLLVDMSGSMGTPSKETNAAYQAAVIAQLFVEALSTHENVTVKVLAHTGDGQDANEGQGGTFYRVWEQGDPINRLSLLWEGIQQFNNYDSWAVAWAGKMLLDEPAQQKLLVVLSDGQPFGRGSRPQMGSGWTYGQGVKYGGDPARQHVRQVTDRLMRQGVDVVQVALNDEVEEQYQAQMYKHYIVADGENNFPGTLRKLTKLLQKLV